MNRKSIIVLENVLISSYERSGQKCAPDGGHKCAYCTYHEASGKNKNDIYYRNSAGKTTLEQSSANFIENPMGIE